MHHGHMEYFSRACGMISRNVDRITKHARAVHEGNTHAETAERFQPGFVGEEDVHDGYLELAACN